MTLAVCLGGMVVDSWKMALWPQGDVMKQLQWSSAVMAILGTGITAVVGGIAIFVLLFPLSLVDFDRE